VLGACSIRPAKAEENVMRLLPILKQVEQRLHVLPIATLNQPAMTNNLLKNSEIIIDATERPCCRPHNARKQKHYYSGKKHHQP